MNIVFIILIICITVLQGCELFIAQHDDTTSFNSFMIAASSCDAEKIKHELATNRNQINNTVSDMAHANALHLAVDHNCANVVDVLLSAGASVNAEEDGGVTPLHLAAQTGNLQIIDSLLSYHASINALDFQKHTPTDRAELRKKHSAVVYLKSAGGMTAEELATPNKQH